MRGNPFMPPINRSGYGFTDLLNDFENDFFVFYLRGLHGFDSDCHFITSVYNITVFENKVKQKKGARSASVIKVKKLSSESTASTAKMVRRYP
jgi:hypothetical protein